MSDTSVKFFTSSMPGARPIAGNPSTAAYTAEILQDVLVDGFGSRTVSGEVIGGNAVIAFGASAATLLHAVVEVSGASLPAINGEHRVTVANAEQIVFPLDGVADQVVSGTFNVRVAPAGWELVRSGTRDQKAFRSLDPLASGAEFQLEGSATWASLVGYTNASGFGDPDGGRFPTSGAGQVRTNTNTPLTSWAWVCVADSRTAWFFVRSGNSIDNVVFGDFFSVRENDSENAFLFASQFGQASISDLAALGFGRLSGSYPQAAFSVPRPISGVGPTPTMLLFSESFRTGDSWSGTGGSGAAPQFPSPVNNGLLLSRLLLVESGVGLRGVFPGVYHIMSNVSSAFLDGQFIPGTGDLAGRTLFVLSAAPQATSRVAIDITGPWLQNT